MEEEEFSGAAARGGGDGDGDCEEGRGARAGRWDFCVMADTTKEELIGCAETSFMEVVGRTS